MDPIAEPQPGIPGPRTSRLRRGALATGAAVLALGIGAVGASAGGSSDAPASGSSDAVPGFVQETTPGQPADPQPRGDEPCPEKDGSQERGSGATQTPDASDAALS
jgi:hypothetical protein